MRPIEHVGTVTAYRTTDGELFADSDPAMALAMAERHQRGLDFRDWYKDNPESNIPNLDEERALDWLMDNRAILNRLLK